MIPYNYGMLVSVKLYCLFPIFSPITYAWEGGVQLANDPDFDKMVVTKEEFEEYGHSICQEKFDV